MGVSTAYTGPHTFNRGPWHFCDRCALKCKLDGELQWQRGLLLCNECYDKGIFPLEGQREQAIALTLQDGKVDFKISDKLQEPVVDSADLMLF